MDRRSISMFLDEEGNWCGLLLCLCLLRCCSSSSAQLQLLAEKRQRERRDTRDATRSSTPPIPEEPEDVDIGYESGDCLSPPERQQHPAAAIHRQHAPPSRSDTRTSTGFREPRVTWHHEGPAIAIGGAQYPGAAHPPYVHPLNTLETKALYCCKVCGTSVSRPAFLAAV